MMARVGLSVVIGTWAWCATQSMGTTTAASSHSKVVWACSTHVGWAFGFYPKKTQAMPSFEAVTTIDAVRMEEFWRRYYQIPFSLFPGAEYRQYTWIKGHLLHFDHWFICLIFLIATVATHWRWKKPAPVQENDA